MSSKQRVFSHDSNINYIDYIKLKNGSEILKTIKNKDLTLNQFVCYNQYIALTHAYYKQINNDKCILHPTKNIYESNNSFISTKIREYDDETNDADKYANTSINNKMYYNSEYCKGVSDVLYPYAAYCGNKNANIYFPYKLDLNNWCLQKKQCINDLECNIDNNCDKNNCDKNNCDKNTCKDDKSCIDSNSNCVLHNKIACKTGLCKGAKPLFI